MKQRQQQNKQSPPLRIQFTKQQSSPPPLPPCKLLRQPPERHRSNLLSCNACNHFLRCVETIPEKKTTTSTEPAAPRASLLCSPLGVLSFCTHVFLSPFLHRSLISFLFLLIFDNSAGLCEIEPDQFIGWPIKISRFEPFTESVFADMRRYEKFKFKVLNIKP